METIVRCSALGCRERAAKKIAARWTGNGFAELKTYGFTCPEHDRAVVAYALGRPNRSHHMAEGESIGEVGTYPLAGG
ncbi:MAG TPA: hypothetical protein VG406_01420 [Isosphaeraceae bacterium]|jgi:hypothetical protein|nr:hypothetical protein [Isosphaeraceae bacterium]